MRINTIIFLLVFSAYSFAQEGVSGLLYYPDQAPVKKSVSIKSSNAIADTMELPFFDDFVQQTSKPDPEKWTNSYAYINNTLAVDPPSIGVATLDAIDDNGNVYTNIQPSFVGDTLTSQPINLEFTAANNIVFSFFYQPQGLADNPEAGDSLMLEFYANYEDTLIWENVWAASGTTLQDFKYVAIPITEDKYLYSGFQFRFMNYVSFPKPQGEPEKLVNTDHWHIDFVYLDTARTVDNGSFDDVAITKSIRGILKTYSSIPAKHFPDAFNTEKASKLAMTYRNLDLTRTKSVERKLHIQYKDFADIDSLGKLNIAPDTSKTIDFRIREIPLVDNPPDYAELNLTAFIIPDTALTRGYLFRSNDTVKYTQVLDNYYSYDDGSPENGYFASGDGTNTDNSIACKYKIYKEDTLQAVQIYFIPTKKDTTEQLEFIIKVWALSGEIPGDTIYSDHNMIRTIGTTGRFNKYVLERPVVLPEHFFVGITQLEDKRYNIGLDRNNNHQDMLFYFLNNEWKMSSIAEAQGSIMIRPVVGDKSVTGIIPSKVHALECTIYPNPANDFVTIDISDRDFYRQYRIALFDIAGKVLYNEVLESTGMDISTFENGLYFIKISDQEGAMVTKKLLISH
ncbi:MAG: T9SS type A sorting domain-containing protein [Bacteroidales bacterium]|nr:T9SS type A sorting domain-containing protein [Bacteroidales bacterium]